MHWIVCILRGGTNEREALIRRPTRDSSGTTSKAFHSLPSSPSTHSRLSVACHISGAKHFDSHLRTAGYHHLPLFEALGITGVQGELTYANLHDTRSLACSLARHLLNLAGNAPKEYMTRT